jgi:tyrosine-protein kinase Etk/Wzc
MSQINNINMQEDNDLKKVFELLFRNYKLFIFCIFITISLAFLLNRYSVPVYKIAASVLIKEKTDQPGSGGMNDFLNSSLFGKNQNFQNELWVFQSLPVFKNTVKNINLSVSYFQKKDFKETDVYSDAPFRILFSPSHIQPLGVKFYITFLKGGNFKIKAESKKVYFYNFNTEEYEYDKDNWSFEKNGKAGNLIETKDLAFIVKLDSLKSINEEDASSYCFEFNDQNDLAEYYKSSLIFKKVDKEATIIEISMQSESVAKGIDLINGLMNEYSRQNLERKNYIADRTIDYIDKQLGEISDSLSMTESNLQRFRSANQLLNVAEQSNGISAQYVNLQNQKAELITRKRYYDYVADYLAKNDDYADMIVPSSIGIADQILTTLMTELIAAQAQRSNLIDNRQEKNPLVNKLSIKIDNIKKTIADNISAARQTTDISIDEMNKRVSKIEVQISNLPKTEQQLGGFERKYRLNDAIYNYLLEKRAEAKITKASNLPDDIVIEPAGQVGDGPISPNPQKNYLVALILGMGLPFGFLVLSKALNTKIETQENIERMTSLPVLGKIIHNHKKTNNVVFEYPKSPIAESYRVLRTNIDFSMKGLGHKVILVTSCITGEGKSFNALNIAMSYAQLGRRTLLMDFDLRKQTTYFNKLEDNNEGLSSYLINKAGLNNIIRKSPDDKLDYITSGPIPHNPAELLALDETKKLISELKNQYDYIIIDTPPLAQVTDGFLIMESSDLKIIIVRYNYSKKKVLAMVLKDLQHKNIENTSIVLNDNRIKNDQYGYGYGYNKKGR